MSETEFDKGSRLGAGLVQLRALLRSMAYRLEWESEGELVLCTPLSGRKTAVAPEHVDYVLSRLFCP
ncbi:hypothetical protein [Mesorhizobium sp. SP-1A]|uniref:hypothetical protein n=1 Tax=Mesorhizobium sp. SP-1A TaxID=3077840 RepID=UPI0028F6DA1E|nr:hypothetical protein [Mesorhizobium sp. SP-1A]